MFKENNSSARLGTVVDPPSMNTFRDLVSNGSSAQTGLLSGLQEDRYGKACFFSEQCL